MGWISGNSFGTAITEDEVKADAYGHIAIRAERGEPRMSLLTHDEQTTLITPLMFGGSLPDNDEVLGLNREASSSRQMFSNGNQVARAAELPGSKAKHLAVLSIGDAGDERVTVKWADLGLPSNCVVRDLWSKQTWGPLWMGASSK